MEQHFPQIVNNTNAERYEIAGKYRDYYEENPSVLEPFKAFLTAVSGRTHVNVGWARRRHTSEMNTDR